MASVNPETGQSFKRPGFRCDVDDLRTRRALPAPRNEVLERLRRPLGFNADRTVRLVHGKPRNAQGLGERPGAVPEKYALHAAGNPDSDAAVHLPVVTVAVEPVQRLA